MGEPPPWSHLELPDRQGITLDQVRTRLDERGLLGVPEAPLVIEGREIRVADGEPKSAPWRHSAVLVGLFEESGEARVVLTRRASHLRTHKGEVSFPGGRMDDGETPTMTALREAHEEVGLLPEAAKVVGHLPSIVTLVSGALIQPVVVTYEQRPTLIPAEAEVERAFDVALADLLADGVFHEERWYRPELEEEGLGSFPLWFFETSGEMIWGATGRLLMDLLSVVLDVAHPRGYRA